jgi:hypothetical protein
VNTMPATKKTKQENPFKLGAAVALFRPGSGVERLGQIVKTYQVTPDRRMGGRSHGIILGNQAKSFMAK